MSVSLILCGVFTVTTCDVFVIPSSDVSHWKKYSATTSTLEDNL